MMMAYVMFTETVESYRFHWKEQKRKAKSNAQGKGDNPYRAMRKKMGL